MIVAENVTKRYGSKTAVDGVSFTVRPGTVTGFLGPNGAGKSTTMRMIVGLDAPTSGRVEVNGSQYGQLRSPLTEVGVLLDAKAVHTGRSARDHLRAMAATHGIPNRRVDEVIALTGLDAVARKRAGKFSLGMGQRLGIAAALLGDPRTLILDEPVNGLDPEGVRWVRDLVRHLAAEGRTVLLSSHLMSEMSQTADHLIVLGRGRVLADASLTDLVHAWTTSTVAVRTPQASDLVAAIAGPDVTVADPGDGTLLVTGISAPAIGDIARDHDIALHELTPRTGSLEEAYMALTEQSVEYKTKDIA
ncbi:MAG: multidrug ABC transporter ATP-binding protein [Microbacterium sp. SCN 70-27]|uniref:ABC transporter ATP-binding protein n=1 Tax=unclassified Microbacterium TaxID=2609290 RepID=UPI00086AA030|nr:MULTISPECIES: ABC transporter ATP-binding protein [unclassified Microbacterium]MBN9223413.1 ABC transporter ATP-binding protein [Microbacterium sp.]ODT28708.1 MAG: multidrug ABC transporter ATP-binding protein [Microbacterium sp. SCN 70-27]